MRLVRLAVSTEQRDVVTDVLDERGIDYVASANEEADTLVFEFPIPTDAVGNVFDALDEAGIREDTYRVTTDAEAVKTPNIDAVRERFAEDYTPLPGFELRAKARSLSNDTVSYAWLMALSAIIAAAGLLIDSPAIVVGSMVIAPIIGPILTTGVGTVTADREMLAASVRLQVVGVFVSVAAAAIAAFALQWLAFVPARPDAATIEMLSLRLAPSPVAVVIGIAAGAAAGYGLTTTGPLAIIGVMIAAALIPAAAASGIGIAQGRPTIAVGAFALLTITVAAINAAVVASLWLIDFRKTEDPRSLSNLDARRVAVLGAAVLVAAASLGIAVVATGDQTSFRQHATTATEDVVSQGRYDGLRVVSIETRYGHEIVSDRPPSVTVTLSQTTDETYDDVPDEIHAAITERSDENPVVRVQFVEYKVAGAPENSSATAT